MHYEFSLFSQRMESVNMSAQQLQSLDRQRLDRLANAVKDTAARARTEEDLRIGLEFLLAETLSDLGLEPTSEAYRTSMSG